MLRRWRRRFEGFEPGRTKAGRPPIGQEEAAEAAGVTKQMIGKLERGARSPGLRLAARLSEMGVCEAEDWTRPAKCAACGRMLDHGPMAPACRRDACPYPDLFVAEADAEQAA